MLELLLKDVGIDEKNSSNKDVGMEVFIHVTLDGIGAVGRVDLCYNGQVISYGNYDDRSFRLLGIGSRVFCYFKEEKYVKGI